MSESAAVGISPVHVPPTPYVIPVKGPEPHGTQLVLVDPDGRLLGEPLRDVGRFESDGRGGLIAPARDLVDRWGFLDQEGRWLSEPRFEQANSVSPDGLAMVRRDNRWGYADRLGQVVIEPRFVEAGPLVNGLAAVRTAGGFGYIDRTGELVLAGPFHTAGIFSAVGLAAVQLDEGGRVGFIDTTGEVVIAPRYIRAMIFGPAGAAPASIDANAGEAWGLIDQRGEWIVEPRFRQVSRFNRYGLAHFSPQEGMGSGYLNAEGRAVITVDEGELSTYMACGLVKHRSGSGTCFLGIEGAMAFDEWFDWAEDFHSCGAAVAHCDGEWGILRTDDQFLLLDHDKPLKDDTSLVLGFHEGRGLAPFVDQDGDTVYVDRDGQDLCLLVADEDGLTLRSLAADGQTDLFWPGAADPDWAKPTGWFLDSSSSEELLDEILTGKRDLPALVQSLAEAEPQPFLPQTKFEERDPYDVEELEEYEMEQVRSGAMVVLAESYVSEADFGEYEFEGHSEIDDFASSFSTVVELLTEHFGEPDRDGEELRSKESGETAQWPVGDSTLMLQYAYSYGDGDIELYLWLAVVASQD